MDSQASRESARKIAPVYLVWSGEFMIDAPLERVWAHALNYPSWQDYSMVRHLEGPVGGEGELVLLKKEESGFNFPPYYARTIKLDQNGTVIWKVFLEKGSQPNDFFGIVEFRVHRVQTGTRFWYNCIYEFEVPYHHESELDAFRKTQFESFDAVFAVTFPKLKALAEGSEVSTAKV
jgi:hypothetical protein